MRKIDVMCFIVILLGQVCARSDGFEILNDLKLCSVISNTFFETKKRKAQHLLGLPYVLKNFWEEKLLLETVLLLEAIYATLGIHHLLSASVEWV